MYIIFCMFNTLLCLTCIKPLCRVFFSEWAKCDAFEINLGKSFSAAIRIARTKPIVQMLEEIRMYVISSNEKKCSEVEKAKGEYTSRSIALLDK